MGNDVLENTVTTDIATDITTDITLDDGDETNINDNFNKEGDENNVEEKKGFDIEDVNFDEEYKIGNYDFGKYKGVINPENLHLLNELSSKYAEKGFTQEQIEFLIDEELENQNTPKDRESILADLNKSLTFEEKQSYKATGAIVKKALDENGMSKYFEEIMTNPIGFKIVNTIIKSMGKGANVGARTERESRQSSLSGYQAVEEFNKYMRENLGNTNKDDKIKELMAKLGKEEDKKYFKETLGL